MILIFWLFSFYPVQAQEIVYFKNTERKIYAEFPSKLISVHCSQLSQLEEITYNSLGSKTYLKVSLNNQVIEFWDRRNWPIETCIESRKKIRRILKKYKRVRVLGIEKYQAEKNLIMYTFDRLDNGKGVCYGYFNVSCEIPDRVETIISD